MKTDFKNYFFLFLHALMLFPLVLYIKNRFNIINQYYSEMGIEFDVLLIAKGMKIDLVILLLGILSSTGIIFKNKIKFFYFISSFFGAIQFTILLLIPTFSYWYFILIISEIFFLWLLMWSDLFLNEYSRKLKLFHFLFFVVILLLSYMIF